MPKYVICPDVALYLAQHKTVITQEHHLLALTLLRSQVLSLRYRAVRRGALTQTEAEQRLNYVRALRLRLLGDRVLQRVAWKVAEQLGWPDMLDAEYIAGCR
jgi:predicted nucleic acid-binding protein